MGANQGEACTPRPGAEGGGGGSCTQDDGDSNGSEAHY